MQPEIHFIRLEDYAFGYIDVGQGVPLVLLHGGGATDLRTWGAQVEPFSQHFRVIAYSRRCHYPNQWMGDGSEINATDVHVSDLAALITALELGPVHLAGTSYGADIILRCAVEHPELVRSLVVAEPPLFSWLPALPGGVELFTQYAANIKPARQAARAGDLDLGVRLFIASVTGSQDLDDLPAALISRMKDNARLIAFEPIDLSEITTDITRDQAAAIKAPVLILTGEHSPQQYLRVSQELARLLPQAERARIPNASHLLHSMNPADFNRVVLDFLARHSPENFPG